MRIIITIGPVATDIASRRYLTHAQFIEYEEGRRRYGLNRLSSNEIEATWGMQLEDPHVPKDVVEGQARIRVGLWTEFYDQASTHKVFRAIDLKEDTMATYGSIDRIITSLMKSAQPGSQPLTDVECLKACKAVLQEARFTEEMLLTLIRFRGRLSIVVSEVFSGHVSN